MLIPQRLPRDIGNKEGFHPGAREFIHAGLDKPATAGIRPSYLSANSPARLKIFRNISFVSFPVCVFWFEGW
jgi:hypothetical protein